MNPHEIDAKTYRRVMSLIKEQCRLHAIKFLITSKEPDVGGYFDEHKLVISKKTRIYPGRKKMRSETRRRQALVGLHELIHLWQWARKDPVWTGDEDDYSRLSEYMSGDKYYTKSDLRHSLRTVCTLESEAEFSSLRLAKSLGVDISSNDIRSAKAYIYSYQVLTECGMWPSRKLRAKWFRHLTSTLEWDLTHRTLRRLIQITKDNEHLCTTIWQGKNCIKKP